MTFCKVCEASLTETDLEAGRCTQCSTSIQPSEIEQIEAHPIYGNHYSDCNLLNRIDKFIQSDAPMSEKSRALVVINRVMGIDEPTDEQAVLDYLAVTFE